MAEGFIQLRTQDLQKPEGVASLNRMLERLFSLLPVDGEKVIFSSGFGTPENAVTASIGSLFLRKDGGANTTLYVKESGTDTDTGWAAI